MSCLGGPEDDRVVAANPDPKEKDRYSERNTRHIRQAWALLFSYLRHFLAFSDLTRPSRNALPSKATSLASLNAKIAKLEDAP